MNLYEQELRRFFADSEVISDQKYCGKTMLGKIGDELRVKLQFISTHVADHYDAIRAQVINRTDGQVDCQTFRFNDILGDNPFYPSNPMAKDIHIWEYNGKPEWYGYCPSPAAAEKIADTINGYISMYQDEGMGMNM